MPKGGGGGPWRRYPSVFWPTTLDWYLGPTLRRYAAGDRRGDLICELEGCDGRSLGRLYRPEDAAEARHHNRHALEALIDDVLDIPPERRAAHFAERCRQAQKRTVELAAELRVPELRPSRQVVAWSVTA